MKMNIWVEWLLISVGWFLLAACTALAVFFSGGAPVISIAIIGLVFGFVGALLLAVLPKPNENVRRYCFYLLCLYLFLLVVWPRYALVRLPGLPGLSPPRLVQLGVLLLWTYLIIKSDNFRERAFERFGVAKPFIIMLSVFIGLKFFSIFISDFPMQSAKGWMNELLSFYVLFFIALSVIESRDDFHLILKSFTLAFLVVCVVGVYEFYVGRNVFFGLLEVDSDYLYHVLRDKDRAGAYRIQSTFSHPLTLSECVVMAMPLVAILFFGKKITVFRASVFMLLLALGAFVVLKTGSRSGLGAFFAIAVCALFLMCAREIKNQRSGVATGFYVLVFIAIVGCAAIGAYLISDLLVGRTLREYNSGMVRLDMWKHGLRLAADSPILGYGQDMAAGILGFSGYGGAVTIDSYYLSILLESGVISLLVYVAMIVFVVVKSLGFGMRASEYSFPALMFLSALIGFFLIKSILSTTHNHGLVMIFIGCLFWLFSNKNSMESRFFIRGSSLEYCRGVLRN
ncbi:MAG: hypothetical protein CVU32_02330 [Betaproteobacteria bacterium HGW-Betaproteobacteria-5]|jgi:O-antigen ligase|nr:MAG: hypothetical protein CVU32_02330 [Betaproteobacteria bacterium HGW-Betaproteobacteria-5]PKO39472.1 MAG: hypothetical protein CVU33_04970 [Betaproteobacteria bacterium HGW-Betaproteobacteria-6]